MPRTTVTMGGVGGAIVLDTAVTIDANDAIVITITPTGGGAPEEYWIRCVPPDFPHHHDVWRRRPAAWLVHPRQQRRADQRSVRNDRGLGGRPRLVQERRREPCPARPQASRRRIARMVPDVPDPGSDLDPANGYENFRLDGTLDRSHPDRRRRDQPPRSRPAAQRQLPAHRRCSPPLPPALPPTENQPCRRQNATGTYPAVTSDFVLRAIVQEVTPAGTLVRDWDSTGDIALDETTVPICFQFPAATGDDYLSTIHPNAIDLEANGPGTADDQLIVSARHDDAIYGINFDAGSRRLEARRHPHAPVADDCRRSARRPAPSARRPRPAQWSRHDVRQSHELHRPRRFHSRRSLVRRGSSSTPSTRPPTPRRSCARSATRSGSSPARPGALAFSRMVASSSAGVLCRAPSSRSTTPTDRSCSRCTCQGSTPATGR